MTHEAAADAMGGGGLRRERLLGQLVNRGFGAGRLEVMATFAVTCLLGEPDVAARFNRWLAEHTGVALPPDLEYRPEAVVGNGRIDVAGAVGGRMHVALEAKFDAALVPAQVEAYAPVVQGSLLAVVVPERRVDESEAVLEQAAPALDTHRVTGVVLTWDALTAALEAAGTHGGDVEQLRSLCRAAAGLDVGHFSEHDLGPGREHRLGDLHAICDRVTAELHRELAAGPLFPTQRPSEGFSGYRYVCPGRGSYCFAVGVRSWETAPAAAVWMRWHRNTGHSAAAAIEARLRAAGYQPARDHGHVWVPLEVPVRTDARAIVAGLVDEVRRLDAAAREASIA